MRQLHGFIFNIESEISIVLGVLQDVVQEVSQVYKHVVNVQAVYEKRRLYPHCPDVIDENEDLHQSFSSLHAIMVELDIEVGTTLSLAGVRLDSIRTKVINAKINFQSIHDSRLLFEAVDRLILELDNICNSLEKNLKRISATVFAMDEWT